MGGPGEQGQLAPAGAGGREVLGPLEEPEEVAVAGPDAELVLDGVRQADEGALGQPVDREAGVLAQQVGVHGAGSGTGGDLLPGARPRDGPP